MTPRTTTPRTSTERTASPRTASRRTLASNLGFLAPVGAVAFTASWIVLSQVSDGYQMWDISVRPYSSVAQPISGLGLGSTAPWMNTAFVACGSLISVGTWSAMRSWPKKRSTLLRWARPMVIGTGLGMALCGIFDLEAIMLHTLGFVLAAGVSSIGFSLAGRALRGSSHRALSAWLQLAGPAGLVGVIAFMMTFDAVDAGRNVGYAGLVQRVLVTVVMALVSAIGLSGRRRTPFSLDERRERCSTRDNASSRTPVGH